MSGTTLPPFEQIVAEHAESMDLYRKAQADSYERMRERWRNARASRQASHTPAPWAVFASDTHPAYSAIWGNLGLHGQVQIALLPREASEGDAALLVASPDLYAALKEVLPFMDTGSSSACAAQNRAIDALRKAERKKT